MTLFEDTNPRELKELLRQVHAVETVLPDFQRDFVWDPNATQELIVSIASNYPAGSLLRIRNTHDLFAFREFQGAPPLNDQRPTYLVLDGQQRLTSLYQAFYAVGDHRYYLNLRKLMDGAEFEDCVFHLRANTKEVARFADFEVQAEQLILPLGVLRGGAGDFLQWVLNVARRFTGDERNKLEDELSKINERWIQSIDDYRFPVVTLSDTVSAEAVCTIFETLNRTGVKLSPFELLTARFWPKNVNLRELWAKALEDFPIIREFEVDPYYSLQIVALLAKTTPSCKRSDVLNLKSSEVEQWWDSGIWGIAKGLEMLRGDCGVFVPRWLPYSTALIPLGAVLGKLGLSGSPEVGANKQKLIRWFWCSVLGQTYENSPNTQAAKDVGEVLRWLSSDGQEPESVSAFKFDPKMLRDTTYRQRALYRGVICLVLSRGPRDFYSSDRLTPEMLFENNVEDHHIFPYAYLGRQNVPLRLRDCVLNRTLIDGKTNRSISDKAPSVYLTEIRKVYDEKGLDGRAVHRLLESHLLPADHTSPLWKDEKDDHDNFERFLDWRQQAVWEQIKRVTGIREASDLIDDEAVG